MTRFALLALVLLAACSPSPDDAATDAATGASVKSSGTASPGGALKTTETLRNQLKDAGPTARLVGYLGRDPQWSGPDQPR